MTTSAPEIIGAQRSLAERSGVHYHGWGLFLPDQVWRLASTSNEEQRARRLLHRKIEDNPHWRIHTSDRMVRRCTASLAECPYWYDEDYIF